MHHFALQTLHHTRNGTWTDAFADKPNEYWCNLCKMYRIIDEKMVANSPINADFFNAYTTHTSVTAPYFFICLLKSTDIPNQQNDVIYVRINYRKHF